MLRARHPWPTWWWSIVNAHSTCYLFYGSQPCCGDCVPGLHDGGCVGLLRLLVIYFIVFSHATGTVSLAYMMVDVWDCSLYLLFILWFSAMLRGQCAWPTWWWMCGTAPSTCYLFYGFQPCYGDGVPGLHDGGRVGLLTLLVSYFMVSAMLRGRCPWPTWWWMCGTAPSTGGSLPSAPAYPPP